MHEGMCKKEVPIHPEAVAWGIAHTGTGTGQLWMKSADARSPYKCVDSLIGCPFRDLSIDRWDIPSPASWQCYETTSYLPFGMEGTVSHISLHYTFDYLTAWVCHFTKHFALENCCNFLPKTMQFCDCYSPKGRWWKWTDSPENKQHTYLISKIFLTFWIQKLRLRKKRAEKYTRAVSDCLIRPLPASVNALLVNCA